MKNKTPQEIVDQVRVALTQQEHHLSFAITLMEHLVVPTFVLDAERRVIIWNRACERLTDIPAAEILGTRDHWRAFYEFERPCLADLVAGSCYESIADLYTLHDDPGQPAFGVHAENWCWMPRRRQRLYLAVDAGPVYDEAGQLIAVIETLRDITDKQIAQRKVIEQADLLKAHYDAHQREAELARQMLQHQIRADLMAQAKVRHSVIPASNFSGDMVLAARSPQGRLYAILADATGHGLAAAVSVLPMVQEFYRLVDLDTPLGAMVESINFMLANSLPVGAFVAAAFVALDESARCGEIWVGGVPDILMVAPSGEFVRRFSSRNLPLGITRSSEGIDALERFEWSAAAHLLLLSDGVGEAENASGEALGEARLLHGLANKKRDGDLLLTVQQTIDLHLDGCVAHDDMSILVIDCPA